MLDPWDCTNHGFDLLVEEYQEPRPKKKKKSVRCPDRNERSKSDMQFYFKPGGNQDLDRETIQAFTEMYPESISNRFYIYDTFTNRYVETITNPRDGVISRKPALFKSLNEHKFEFQDKEDDMRSSSILERIYENILISVLRDSEYTHRKLIAQNTVQYKIVPFTALSSSEFKKHCVIEYKDLESNTKVEMKDMIKTACQLYNIYPGRVFYIYDVEDKTIFKHVKNANKNIVVPIEFTYLNGAIIYNVPDNEDLDKDIKNVVTTIYNDFMNGHLKDQIKYPSKYRLIKKSNVDPDELKEYLEDKENISAIDKIFMNNNIKKEHEYWCHFYLRTCLLNKDSWNVLLRKDGNTVTFIEFMYSKDDGLVATNVGLLDIDVNTLKDMENQIIDGTLVPVDIDTFNKRMEKEEQIKITFNPFQIHQK